MLSEEKITHLAHVLLRELIERDIIETASEEGLIRKEIKRTIVSELEEAEDIDAKVRKKLESFSRKIVEGSSEWEILYKKFFKEEEVKRGKR